MHWSTMLSTSFFAALLMLLACAQTARAAASLIKSPPPSKSSKDTASPYPPEYNTVETSFGEPLAMSPPPPSVEPTPSPDSGTVATSTDKPASTPGDAAKSPATSPLPQSPEPTPPKDTGTVATRTDNLSPTNCGGRCKPCCPNEKCNASYLCNSQSKHCEPERGQEGVPGPPDCGFEGVRCCPEVRPPSSSLCPGTGKPDKGDVVPPGTKCDAGLMCESNKCMRPTPPPPPPAECGSVGAICCVEGDQASCDAGLACGKGGKCVKPDTSCGKSGQQCCIDTNGFQVCKGKNLVCSKGRCLPKSKVCGQLGCKCCRGRRCSGGLTCSKRNTCVVCETGCFGS
jgi:hypothetical protein